MKCIQKKENITVLEGYDKRKGIILIYIMWLASQSDIHLLFIFIEMKFYSLSFLCDVCNEVHEHMQ